MLTSEVLFSRLEDRIDAGFYATKIHIEERLKTKALNFEPMETLCDFPKAKTPPQEGYTDSGVPVLKLKNITDYFIDWKDVSFVPERLYSNLFQPKKEDLLITATGEGTIGRVNIFDEDEKCIVTGEVMIVKPNPQKVNPYFLLTYLRCKYGKPQLIRFVRGATGQTHLYSKDVKQILVPIPSKSFQEHVEELVKEAHEKKKIANQRYKEAEQLLYKELGIEKLELTREKNFETTFSEVEKTMRFDSEYYQPKYTVLMKELDKLKSVESLEKISKSIISGSYVKDYVPKGAIYLRVQNIRENKIDLRDIKFVNVEKSKIPEKIRVKPNDVLLTRTGTTGVAFVATKDLEGAVISQHLTRIVLQNNINPDYVAVCLNSQMCRLQMERPLAGSLQKELIHAAMKSVKIPILPLVIQEKIAEEIKKSLEVRKEAKSLLDQVKTEVEELIEGV